MIFSYARVSTAEQAASGSTSLAEQERKNKAIASLRGAGSFDFVSYVDAGVSGSIPLDERPAGKDMLAAAKKGDVIVATKMDRLFRSATDALVTAKAMRQRGVDIILIDMGTDPVTGNGVAKMFFGMLALVAEFERERIAERMEDGRRGKRERQGELACLGTAPYGYQKVGLAREARLEPVPEEQRVVKLVKYLSRRKKPRAIRRQLKHFGLRSRSGKDFQVVQIRRMLARQVMH